MNKTEHSKAVNVFQKAIAGLIPPKELTPVEWAEENVVIPEGNAIPGKLRFDNAPFQREPINTMGSMEVYKVTLMWGAQTGKTNSVNVAIGYHMEHKGNSVIMMQPSENDVKTWLNTKFDPMVKSCKALYKKMSKPRERGGVNTQTMKSFIGGFLMMAWSGSPKTMRGRSAPIVANDEVDAYETTDEGHPVDLLAERSKTYGENAIQIITSTPTFKGSSFVEQSYLEGDQREYYVPCPHCDHYQTLKWSGIMWDKTEEGEHLPETAHYICEECACIIEEKHKVSMVRNGKWIASKPFKGHASFHLTELTSLMSSWSNVVRKFLEQKKKNDLRAFFNTVMAETWEEKSEGLSAESLIQRVEPFNAEVPKGVGVLTCAVDVQNDRIELEVKGWGIGYENWSIDYKVFYGDPLLDENNEKSVWYKLNQYRQRVFMHENGHQLKISCMVIDSSSGEHTDHVYQYCVDKKAEYVFPIKGRSGWSQPLISAPSEKRIKRTGRKVSLFIIGVDVAKQIVHRRFGVTEVGASYCHVPDDRSEEYFLQLTAEKVYTKYFKGKPVREWRMVRSNKRNEALDIAGYNEAAFSLLQCDIAQLVKNLALTPEAKKEAETPRRVVRSSRRSRVRKSRRR